MTRDKACARFAPTACAVAICLCALLAPDRALAFSSTSRTHFYDIAGNTGGELSDAMERDGPHGYWAYTTWRVHWSGSCKVSVRIDYTMPHWRDRDAAPAALREAWDRMLKNLWRHEKGHAQHGLKAAAEIEASHCAGDPHDVTDKWIGVDKAYDEETDHGARQGVRLPDTSGEASSPAGESASRPAQP